MGEGDSLLGYVLKMAAILYKNNKEIRGFPVIFLYFLKYIIAFITCIIIIGIAFFSYNQLI